MEKSGKGASQSAPTNIQKTAWQHMLNHAITHYPSEACGILAGPVGVREGTVFYICKNIYDDMHAKDPATYPRTSKTAYLIDGTEQQALFETIKTAGLEVKAIVHSHTDHDAYFSEEDRYVAAPWGEPFYPEISYIVISVWNKQFKEANEFLWNKNKEDFEEFKLK